MSVGVMTVGVMSVGVMTVGVMSVGEITVGVMTVGVMRRPRINLQMILVENYRHFFLVFVRLFLCSPIHPFKRLIILNVTNRLTLDGNINNVYVHACIRKPL